MTDSVPPFRVIVREDADVLRIVVRGDFDAYTAPQFDAACEDAEQLVRQANTPPPVHVDLGRTTLIDSGAITSILLASKRFPAYAVHAPHSWQERLFGIVGLWESVDRV